MADDNSNEEGSADLKVVNQPPPTAPPPPHVHKPPPAAQKNLRELLEKSRSLAPKPAKPPALPSPPTAAPQAIEDDGPEHDTDELEPVSALQETRPDIELPPDTIAERLIEDDTDPSAQTGHIVDPGPVQYAPADPPVLAAALPAQVPAPAMEPLAYGILPDIGERSRSGEHIVAPVNTDPRRVIAAAGAVGVLALVALTAIVIQRWASPERAWIWFCAGMFAATLLTSTIVPWEPEVPSRRQWLMVRVGPAIGGLVAGAIAALLWSVPFVRAGAVGRAGDDVAAMQRVFGDPSDEVSGKACRRYIVHFDDPGWWSAIYAAMSKRPGLATTCLEGAAPETAAQVTKSLADRWSRELGGQEQVELTEELACSMANGLVKLPMDVNDMSARLLDCTLSSTNADAQECCANALAGTVSEPRQWAQRLRGSVKLVEGAETPSGVFAMAFHQQGITPAQKKFADAVNFTGVEGRGAALELVCESISKDRDRVIRHLQGSLDEECPVDVAALPTDRSFWTYVCDATVVEVRTDRTRPPVDTLCTNVIAEAAPRAIETARRMLVLARTKPGSGVADRGNAQLGKLLTEIELTDHAHSLNMSPDERAALRAERDQGSVVVFRTKEQRELYGSLDAEGRKKYDAWEASQKQKILDTRHAKRRK